MRPARAGDRPPARAAARLRRPSVACRRSISRVRPSRSVLRVGNSSAFGAADCTSASQRRLISNAGPASGVRASRSASNEARCAASADGSARPMVSSLECASRRRWASWCMRSVNAATRDCRTRAQASRRAINTRAPDIICSALSARVNSSMRCSNTFRADDRLARIRRIATRTVEIGQQRGAEAPRQPGARQMPQVGELPQAHALQRFPVFAAGAEQPHRRIVEKASQRAEVAAVRAVHEITAPAREHGCTERRGCARDLQPVAERMQHALQAIDQSRRPPKQRKLACTSSSTTGAAAPELSLASTHTIGVNESAAYAAACKACASRAGSAWPSTRSPASASAVARLAPGWMPSCAARASTCVMRCASISAIGRSRQAGFTVAANDSSDS